MEKRRQLEKFRTLLNYLRPFASLVLSKRTQAPRFQPHAPCSLNKKYGSLGCENEITTACAQKHLKAGVQWFVFYSTGDRSSLNWNLWRDGVVGKEFRPMVFRGWWSWETELSSLGSNTRLQLGALALLMTIQHRQSVMRCSGLGSLEIDFRSWTFQKSVISLWLLH